MSDVNLQSLNDTYRNAAAAGRKLITDFNNEYEKLKNLVEVAESGALGDLAFVSNLTDAPVGNLEEMQSRLGMIGYLEPKTITSEDDLNDIRDFGFYKYSFANVPANAIYDDACMFIVFDDSRYNSDKTSQFFFTKDGRIKARTTFNSGGWAAGIEFLSTKNTTTDANGLIKAASPIFRLSSTPEIAAGNSFKISGHGAGNSEAEGIIAERISEGHYILRNSLGFAREGWTTEIPRGENNEELVWIQTSYDEDTQLITVKVYHRTHPQNPPFARNDIKGYSNGDTIDVPAGRWIDLRLHMPEEEEDNTEIMP